jgi:uncharacterized damage-inducible protein DinB
MMPDRKRQEGDIVPTMVRAVVDERDGCLAFLAEQRAGLRRAVHGLTDEQAAARPTPSGLCLGGLIKHAASVERNWVDLMAGQWEAPSARDPQAGFRMDKGETLSSLLEAYDAVARHTESVVGELPDLEQPIELPRFRPLLPAGATRSARWILFHLIEETARHAGHADIIRESLDGATAVELVTAAEDPLFA